MARIPVATRDSVPTNQRDTFDEIVALRGGPIERGPVSVLINSPEMAKRAGELSSYLRQDSTLASKIQELAMLLTARERDCQFILERPCRLGAQGRPERRAS